MFFHCVFGAGVNREGSRDGARGDGPAYAYALFAPTSQHI